MRENASRCSSPRWRWSPSAAPTRRSPTWRRRRWSSTAGREGDPGGEKPAQRAGRERRERPGRPVGGEEADELRGDGHLRRRLRGARLRGAGGGGAVRLDETRRDARAATGASQTAAQTARVRSMLRQDARSRGPASSPNRFGGAYAALAYVAQAAVEQYGWMKPGEMLDGLGMAETTPGPRCGRRRRRAPERGGGRRPGRARPPPRPPG
jgi:hypothetical protein